MEKQDSSRLFQQVWIEAVIIPFLFLISKICINTVTSFSASRFLDKIFQYSVSNMFQFLGSGWNHRSTLLQWKESTSCKFLLLSTNKMVFRDMKDIQELLFSLEMAKSVVCLSLMPREPYLAFGQF